MLFELIPFGNGINWIYNCVIQNLSRDSEMLYLNFKHNFKNWINFVDVLSKSSQLSINFPAPPFLLKHPVILCK